MLNAYITINWIFSIRQLTSYIRRELVVWPGFVFIIFNIERKCVSEVVDVCYAKAVNSVL